MATRNQALPQLGFEREPNEVRRTISKRANDLDGATWTRYSVSVWSDIKKSPEEYALKHPAMFPVALVRRILKCFTTGQDRVVLDPFCGSGSTILGAMLEGKQGVGFEIVPEYIKLARDRVGKSHLPFEGKDSPEPIIHARDARATRCCSSK